VLNAQATNGSSVQGPNGRNYLCISAGTSGSSPPAWPTGGGTVTDNNVTWQDMGGTFTWPDDLTFTKPEDMTTHPPGKRPVGLFNGAQAASDGNYSWFFTVTPSPVETANLASLSPCELHYTVSIVVCYRRDLSINAAGSPNGESTATASLTGGGLGGGDVMLSPPPSYPNPLNWTGLDLKENNWIALCGGNPVTCRWYRVVSVGGELITNPGSPPMQMISLNGPDCIDWANAGVQPTAVSLEAGSARVVGVYTTTVEVDRDTLW
jgi:hypothetical protein